jgi:hypothetical protein
MVCEAMDIAKRLLSGGIGFGSGSPSLPFSGLFRTELSSPSSFCVFSIFILLLRFILVLNFDILFSLHFSSNCWYFLPFGVNSVSQWTLNFTCRSASHSCDVLGGSLPRHCHNVHPFARVEIIMMHENPIVRRTELNEIEIAKSVGEKLIR